MIDRSWLSDRDHAIVRAAFDRLVPADGTTPAAGAAGGADYVDGVLGAFEFDPPHIWAGGPFSGRHGGEAGFDRWLELGAAEELGWRMRIEGSQGRTEREFNGPVIGWQQHYRAAITALGDDFAEADADEQDARIASKLSDEQRDLMFTHACESLYGDPVYGGNRDSRGWAAIGFVGDIQPRGWTDAQVTERDATP